METLFRFKSYSYIYEKERDDVKNNTVRKIDLNDERFTQLVAWSEIGWNDGDLYIRIQRGKNEKDYFTKEIRDITIWNDLMIITWNEEDIKVSNRK